MERLVMAVMGGTTVRVRLCLIVPLVLAVLLRPGAETVVEAADPMFGNGSDGAITFSTNAQFNPPVDAVVTSGSGSTVIVSSPSGAFVPGQKILIHQTRGTGAGNWELNSVQSYALGTLTTAVALTNSYTSSGADAAQVLVVPQYTDVTVNAGVSLTAKPWSGTVGGILAFLANGTVAVTGSIVGDSTGYRGGTGSPPSDAIGSQGEGTVGGGSRAVASNGNGGGGGDGQLGSDNEKRNGGGGGGNAMAGSDGLFGTLTSGAVGAGGTSSGNVSLTNATFGGGGGQGYSYAGVNKDGGAGGGFLFIAGTTLTASGAITSNGANGVGGDFTHGGGGGGAGGSILLKAQTATFGTALLTAINGAGGAPYSPPTTGGGGAGAVGRIRVEYCTSLSGGYANPPASIAHICWDKAVGGIAEQPDVTALPSAAASGRDYTPYILGTAVALLAAAGAVGWRRRRG